MIILRQKIFFDYSKYTKEEANKIKAERHKTAELLNEERKIAKQKFDSKQKLAKTHFTPMTSDAPEEAAKLINKRDKMIGDAMKSRNEAYEDALKRSEARRKAIEDKINKPKENKTKNATSPNTNKVQGKVGGFIKKAWNGENLTGNKTGNRAAIIGVPILATGATIYGISRARKKKKEEKRKKRKEL